MRETGRVCQRRKLEVNPNMSKVMLEKGNSDYEICLGGVGR